LQLAIAGLERVLVVNCGATPNFGIAFLSSDVVFANTLAVLAYANSAAFCALQSRPHEAWARFFSSSMKDDLRYTSSDCFETFPFPCIAPEHMSGDSSSMVHLELTALEASGRDYYEFRAALMVRNNEGLTKTY